MSLLDAINAAAAALNANQKPTPNPSQREGSARVKPRVRVQPKGSTNVNVNVNVNPQPSDIKHQTSPKQKVQPKGKKPTANVNGNESENISHQPSDIKHHPSDIKHQTSQKQKGGASYVIPKEFKQAIETYLNSRADMRSKLSAKGKSLDGCCDYIFDVMRKRAEKNRGGKSAVGMYVDPQEVFGLAVHYYDESDSALRSESEE